MSALRELARFGNATSALSILTGRDRNSLAIATSARTNPRHGAGAASRMLRSTAIFLALSIITAAVGYIGMTTKGAVITQFLSLLFFVLFVIGVLLSFVHRRLR
ncbi:MAG: hypothetical protein IPF41_03540 [Flavobacteriales bacterium]|nr:hypothetical protein [Flavobacteriales bacterium]